MSTYKIADSVSARIVQIFQEAVMCRVDGADLLRQVRLEVSSSEPDTLVLTSDYKKSVDEFHKKLLVEAEKLQSVSRPSTTILEGLLEMKEEKDDFTKMWDQQEKFMRLLQEKRNFPNFPVDMLSKQGQKLLDEISMHLIKEVFESTQHLKNSKTHRITEIKDINKTEYVEELVDSLHLFFEVCIAAGISKTELIEAYMKKGETNVSRIEGGY